MDLATAVPGDHVARTLDRRGVIARVRPGILLAAVVAASFAVWALVGSFVSSPWIYADELIYSDLARSIAAGGPPSVRGATTYAYGLGYPLVVSPAWVLFRNLDHAYAAARVLNALVMSLAAVPAYFLARRFLTQRSALLVAVFTVAVPSMVYVTTIMTEVAFYPLFLLALLAMQRALEKPSASRQAIALVAIGLAAATKVLALGLLVAWLVAAVLQPGVDGDMRRRVQTGLRAVWIPLGALALGLVGLAIVGGRSPIDLFGAYGAALRNLDLTALPLSIAQQIDALLLYSAVLPLVATAAIAVVAFRRGANTTDRSFAALAIPTVTMTVGGVAVFAVYASGIDYQATGIPRAFSVYERNLFVLAPLLFIGLLRWWSRRPSQRVTAVAGGAAVALLVLYPWTQVADEAANPQNLATFPWVLWPVPVYGLSVLVVLTAAFVVAALLRSNAGSRVPIAIVGVWLGFVSLLAVAIFEGAAAQANRDGVGTTATWIDDAVGPNARVDIVWREPAGKFAKPSGRQRLVWASEFFNRSVVAVDSLGAWLPFGLSSRAVHVGRDGVLVDARGHPIAPAYVMAPCAVHVDAPVVAVDRRTQAAVYRTSGIVRLGGAAACS